MQPNDKGCSGLTINWSSRSERLLALALFLAGFLLFKEGRGEEQMMGGSLLSIHFPVQ